MNELLTPHEIWFTSPLETQTLAASAPYAG